MAQILSIGEDMTAYQELSGESFSDQGASSPLRDAMLAPPSKQAEKRRKSVLHEAASHIKQGAKGLGQLVSLDEESELKKACKEFCSSTTFHGVPMVLGSRNSVIRFLWTVFCIVSLILFSYQVTDVVKKYSRREKIVSVELEFESAPFPAITVCNLNPFKKSLASTVPEISQTLDAFHQAVTYSLDAGNEEEKQRKRRELDGVFQTNGGFAYVQYEPVLSDCDCVGQQGKECIQMDSIPESLEKACICNHDRYDSSAWPCYQYSTWEENMCPGCNDIGFCNMPNSTYGSDVKPCVCHQKGYCLLRSEARIRRIWEFRGKEIPKKGSPFREDFFKQLKALGYENMTDQVAITTQTKEKLILKMAALPVERRMALSYGKSELIRMCSFNGLQCNIEQDFKLHIDPTFGNCYTFNANPKRMFVSSRAGPSYGLRLMVFVNASDYLPTTDATGVRIAIHGQKESPFPDTFGYSAPTGAVSSFGLSLRKVNRLNVSEGGDCIPPTAPLSAGYIYRKYEYEPEGCFKSCYQQHILRKCRCFDPRLPSPGPNIRPCSGQIESTCLLEQAVWVSKRSRLCRCKQPCQQDVYSTTYSAAKWPSGSLNMECRQGSDCIQYYREHAAMLEIYYEQMTYEIIRESQSYQFVNVLSDIGGQAGLWLGASILTFAEFCSFILRLMKIFYQKYDMKGLMAKKRKEEKRRAKEALKSLSKSSDDKYQPL